MKRNPNLACPAIGKGFSDYHCVVTGEHVTSRNQRRELAKRHGLVEIGNEGRPKGGYQDKKWAAKRGLIKNVDEDR